MLSESRYSFHKNSPVPQVLNSSHLHGYSWENSGLLATLNCPISKALTFEINSIPSLSRLSNAKGRWRRGRNRTFIFRTRSYCHTEVVPPGPLAWSHLFCCCPQGPCEASRALCKPQPHACLSGQVDPLLPDSEGGSHETKAAPFHFRALQLETRLSPSLSTFFQPQVWETSIFFLEGPPQELVASSLLVLWANSSSLAHSSVLPFPHTPAVFPSFHSGKKGRAGSEMEKSSSLPPPSRGGFT